MRVWGVQIILGAAFIGGCTFNFDLTSSRTALENQIMGSYQEVSDELILMSTMRGESVTTPKLEAAHEARRNQEFNRDDIEEFKDNGLLAEGFDGRIVVLNGKISGMAISATDQDLARTLMAEENQDRLEIWKYLIVRNKSLKPGDLPEVGRAYGRMQRTRLKPGQWYQNEQGTWLRVASKATPLP